MTAQHFSVYPCSYLKLLIFYSCLLADYRLNNTRTLGLFMEGNELWLHERSWERR